MDEKDKLFKQLTAYAFAAFDWNLYLDTHPDDKEGIAMFHKMANKAKELSDEYQEKYGPLTAASSNNPDVWDWIDNPWPWES